MKRFLGYATALTLSACSAVAIATLNGSDAQMLLPGVLLALAVVVYEASNYERTDDCA